MTAATALRTRHNYFLVINVFDANAALELDFASVLDLKSDEHAQAQVRQNDDGLERWRELRLELTLYRDESPAQWDWAQLLGVYETALVLSVCETG